MFIEELEEEWYRQDRTEEDQERSLRLGALCRVYEQADRVLTGDPVIVNVMPDGPAPAWSDGAAIYINSSEIEDMDLETLTQVTGLNYHELAHHFYTPRKGTDLIKWVLDNDLMESTNILEDQRIETLLCARYPSVAPYLTSTVARWLATDKESVQANYPLIRGRRYLPVEIRQAFRDEFAYPDLIPAIVDIIDEYRLLAFPRDYAKARVLIQRFNDEVLKPLKKGGEDVSGGPNGCGKRDPIAKGRPEPGKAQERDAARAAGMGKAESVYVPKPKEQANANTNNPDQSSNDEGKSEIPMPAPRSAAEALAIREMAANSNPSTEYGEGHHESKGGIPDNINDMLNKALDDVLARKDVQADIKSKQRVIVGGDGKYDDSSKTGKFDLTDVPTESLVAYRTFAKELERLRDECEPGWNKGVPSGRLNVQRIINGCEIDEAFDRWEEGTDGADVEAVILVDRSGSMSGSNDREASQACWTIKRALEAIDAPVTVYAFDDKMEVAYKRTEKAHKTRYKFIYGNGGTNPYSSLLAAEQLLMSSRKKNKMLFIVTDGVFNHEKNDEVIKRISKRGILTAMTLIMRDRDFEYYQGHGETEDKLRHDCEVYARINTARDLIPFAKAVVMGAIKKRR